jgi:5,10-methylene-tetrahydrofolate dehydrogenase/methenyl tetrahydrofolate cyclohydrolase
MTHSDATGTPPQKLIDWREIASELDAQFQRATSAMQEQLGSVPKIVEVAYTNTEFRKMDEDCFNELTDLAKSTGVVYQIDKLYVKDDYQSAAQTLRDRLQALSADQSVDGIQVHAAYYGGREQPLDLNWIDALKDIDCNTTAMNNWLRRGRGWLVKRPAPFIHPSTGSILKVLSHGLKQAPLTSASVALLRAPPPVIDLRYAAAWKAFSGSRKSVARVKREIEELQDPSYYLTLLARVLHCRSLITCVDPQPKDADRIRQADVIVTQINKPGYLDKRYVREGQIVIDLGRDPAWTFKGDFDSDSIIPVIEAYANTVTVGNLKLPFSFLNAMRSFLLKQNKDSANRLLPLLGFVAGMETVH